MKLEEQVCSLELAKRLKELKINQESIFYWRRWVPIRGSSYITPEWSLSYYKGSDDDYEVISAFSVAELGELLPDLIKIRAENYFITMDCDKYIYYENIKKTCEIHFMDNGDEFTEADARAKMLIYLIENEYVES